MFTDEKHRLLRTLESKGNVQADSVHILHLCEDIGKHAHLPLLDDRSKKTSSDWFSLEAPH